MRRFTFKALVVSMAMAFALPAAQAARAHKDAEGSKSARVQAKAKVASSRKAKVIHATLTTKRHAAAQRVAYRVAFASAMAGVPPVLTAGDLAGLNLTRDPLDLNSSVALVLDQSTNEVLFEKNAGISLPIASITKLMTSLVVVEANQDLDDEFREPRSVGARPPFSRRHPCLRQRHEREGARAGHEQFAVRRFHRPEQRQRVQRP